MRDIISTKPTEQRKFKYFFMQTREVYLYSNKRKSQNL